MVRLIHAGLPKVHKYVALLDSNDKFDIPKLEIARKSAIYLYDYLHDNEDEGDFFDDGPINSTSFYEDVFKEGSAVYFYVKSYD